jgi:hypothetical protein
MKEVIPKFKAEEFPLAIFPNVSIYLFYSWRMSEYGQR